MARDSSAQRSVLLHLPGTPESPLPRVAGPVLRTLLTHLDADDAVEVSIALAAEPREEDVIAFLEVCSKVVTDLEGLMHCSLVGPTEAAATVADHVMVELPVPPGRLSVAEQVRQARLLRDLERRPAVGSTVKMLVVAQHMTSWGALEPLVRAADADARVECTVVTLESPFSRWPTESQDAVAGEGWMPTPAPAVVERLSEFDVIVVGDPYDHYRPQGFQLPALLSSGARVVLSPYAENIGWEVSSQYDMPTHNLAWRIYAASRDQVEQFRAHCGAGAGHVRSFGPLKGDWLATESEKSTSRAEELKRSLGAEHVILWNPHFRRGSDGWSTFTEYWELMLRLVRGADGLGLIARPHPMLFDALQSEGLESADLVRRFREACAAEPRVLLDESRDYRPAFLAASAMVSDLSSLIPEYLQLGRPVAYTRHARQRAEASDEQWFQRVTIVDDPVQLEAFLERAPGHLGASGETPVRVGARVIDDIVESLAAEVRSFA